MSEWCVYTGRKDEHTKPVVQLLDPSRSGIFNWRIEEDNLVLYPNFVHNRLDDHMVLHELAVGSIRSEDGSSV